MFFYIKTNERKIADDMPYFYMSTLKNTFRIQFENVFILACLIQ